MMNKRAPRRSDHKMEGPGPGKKQVADFKAY